MRPADTFNNSNNDYLHTLKLKYTAHKNSKAACDHQAFLNSYASLRPVNDQMTDRRNHYQRSPLKNNEPWYENTRDNIVNLKKSIISKANFETGTKHFLKQRSSNLSVQRKQDPFILRNRMGDRSLPKYRQSISVERLQCTPNRKQSQKNINLVSGRQTRRQLQSQFKQNDSPIKLIYESKQNEQQEVSAPVKVQPKAKSNEISQYYRLQRQKTTKTINSIENILASIRNTLNK